MNIADTVALATVTAGIVSVTKFLLDYVVSSANKNQSNLVRLYVYAVAYAVVAYVASQTSQIHAIGDVFSLAVVRSTFATGTGAILTYHLITGLPSGASFKSLIPALQPLTLETLGTSDTVATPTDLATTEPASAPAA